MGAHLDELVDNGLEVLGGTEHKRVDTHVTLLLFSWVACTAYCQEGGNRQASSISSPIDL